MEKDKSTILIVEDQSINRKILCNILQGEYNVVEAENGAVALEQLENHRDIAAILLDIIMPVMDGYEFLRRLGDSPWSSLPVIAVTGEKDPDTEQKALNYGAWDFVSKPYQTNVLMLRLKNVIIRSQFYLLREMQYAYEYDSLTGLFNRSKFLREAKYMLDNDDQKAFAMIHFDIKRFHMLNSFWGSEEGDSFLKFIADLFRSLFENADNCVYGRISADNFAICREYDQEKIENDIEKMCRSIEQFNKDYHIEPAFGIFVSNTPGNHDAQSMLDHATFAAGECKTSYTRHLSYYEKEMASKALFEQQLINEMQTALDEEQFVAYLQPKYNLKLERPFGAEALVRWQHPKHGLLTPGVFLPAFERNGLIGKIDYYMWEKICQLLRKWIDEGNEPTPISVNVLRVNMYNPNLVSLLTGLVKKYDVPPELMNLEMTESAYMDDPDTMRRVITELQENGFIIMMDDFGSGYSSLNTLKDIPIDMLKIDMKFLAGNAEQGRKECIMTSMVHMAGWLETPVIMEGVETLAQVNFLKSIGCGYVQGYYYAKPMSVADYEQLIKDADCRPIVSSSFNHEKLFYTIWSSDSHVEMLFNSIPQPAAIYEFEHCDFNAIRVNSNFNKFFGYGENIGNDLNNEYKDHVSDESLADIIAAFEAAAQSRGSASCEYDMSDREGDHIRIRMDLQYWGANEITDVIFALFTNITDQI